MIRLLLASFVLGTVAVSKSSDPPFDRQTDTYTADLPPVSSSSAKGLVATPYFSPDWSSNVTVELIDAATKTIDIATPSFASWSGCTPFTDAPDCTKGCSAPDVMAEEFPVMPALLNAMHQRGVKVRILTNDFGTPDCHGTFTPLTVLLLNGAALHWYNQTTFMHAKYMAIDAGTASAKTTVSSINYSKTSFTKNREAGAVLAGDAALLAGMQAVYERDFAEGLPATAPTDVPSGTLAILTDPRPLKIVTPGPPTPPEHTPPYYVTPRPQPVALAPGAASLAFASPDFSFATLSAHIAKATKSFDLMMYQINQVQLCDALVKMGGADSGIALRVFVSSRIFSTGDCQEALVCYGRLMDAGIAVRMTTLHYQYSHQKFWIRDGDTVGWSTGNWAPTDYPLPPPATPPSGVISIAPFGDGDEPAAGWIKANRDYTVVLQDEAVVKPFQDVFEHDFLVGYNMSSDSTVKCGSDN